MPPIKTPLEIYKFLEKSNCGLCLKPSCMAFAAAVFRNEVPLSDCPRLAKEGIAALQDRVEKRKSLETEQAAMVEPLKKEIAGLDFAALSGRLGAIHDKDKLIVRVMGKDFVVDRFGNITSECHIIPWVQLPLLNYIISSQGKEITGEWVTFRKLKEGMTRNLFFVRRCEEPLKEIIDAHTELFFDLMDMFQGKRLPEFHGADHAIILFPLPKVPLLICYWEREGDMDSKLTVFFDATADTHLSIESIYYLGTGLVEMFKKVILTHGI